MAAGPGGFCYTGTALRGHFYTYGRISWQKDFPAENHPTNKFPIVYGKWIVLGRSPSTRNAREKSFKAATGSLLRFVFFSSPHQNFDIIPEIITKTGEKSQKTSKIKIKAITQLTERIPVNSLTLGTFTDCFLAGWEGALTDG